MRTVSYGKEGLSRMARRVASVGGDDGASGCHLCHRGCSFLLRCSGGESVTHEGGGKMVARIANSIQPSFPSNLYREYRISGKPQVYLQGCFWTLV